VHCEEGYSWEGFVLDGFGGLRGLGGIIGEVVFGSCLFGVGY